VTPTSSRSRSRPRFGTTPRQRRLRYAPAVSGRSLPPKPAPSERSRTPPISRRSIPRSPRARGVALALACGHLESLALNRASIEALVEHAERSGADAFAFFERLDVPDAAFDLERRRSALLDMV